MLRELQIRNLALVEDVILEWGNGLNVLTGETGAGKTIIITAVNLLLGERATSELVRSGCSQAQINGLFDFTNNSRVLERLCSLDLINQEESELILSRTIFSDGRGKCYINGRLVTLNELANLGDILIDLHGQHSHQSLLKPSLHLEFLDRYSEEALNYREKYTNIYESLENLERELSKLNMDESVRLKKEDLLKFQIDEIEKANLKNGEEELLLKEREILRNAEKIFEAVSLSRNLLSVSNETMSKNVCDLLNEIVCSLKSISGIDVELDQVTQKLSELLFEAEECGEKLRNYTERIDFSSGRLEEIESRLALIGLLKKKYGSTVDEVITYKDRILEELKNLVGCEEKRKNLQLKIENLRQELNEIGQNLSKCREKAALRLEKEVEKQLIDLNMPNVQFKVKIEQEKTEDGLKPFPNGFDLVEFLISPNPGEPLKSLAKIASGGEISRTMLALKIILTRADEIPTLIFDEVDSGIGGKTALAVGQKLATLGSTHQVICVTHLSQIASFADVHFYVSKVEEKRRTVVKVWSLDEKMRVSEIARMLGGADSSAISLEHASELLKSAEQIKKGMTNIIV